MGSHPLNLALRFLLEMTALVAMGYWGWTQFDGALRFIAALGIPLLAAIIWGTFAVPADPSRSGNAPIPTLGIIRLLLELLFFAGACWALYAIGTKWMSAAFALLVIMHYLLSYDRVRWLLTQ